MKSSTLLLVFILFSFLGQAQNEIPKVQFLQASYAGGSLVQVIYSISDSDDDLFEVLVWVSKDGGESYTVYDQVEGDGMIEGGGLHYLLIDGYFEFDHFRITVDDLYQFEISEVVELVDSNRIRSYLENIVGVRHYIENPQKLHDVRTYVQSQLHETCRDTSSQEFLFNNIWKGKNLLGWQQGTITDTKPYLVGGHYDSVDESPGADDNGTAIAAMLEISKVFENFNFNYPLLYTAWDFEESGVVGSSYYVANKPEEIDIQGYLNFEMIGYYSDKPNSQTLPVGFDFLFPDIVAEIQANEFRGDFITNVGNGANSNQMMLDYESIASTYVPELSVISVPSPGAGTSVPDLLRSDHAPFWFQGIPALMLTDGSEFRNKNYHTPLDVIDSLNFDFFSNVVKASVAYLAQKAEIHHKGVMQFTSEDIFVDTQEFEPTSTIECSYLQDVRVLKVNWTSTGKSELSWQIIDMKGSVFQASSWSQSEVEYSIPLKELPTGSYIFTTSDPRGNSTSYQFVIN